MTAQARPFGGMTWSIKDSLLSYVSRAHGEVTLTGDVVFDQGSFSWPLAAGSGQVKDGTLTLRFEGSVMLQAHHGVFQVAFSDPSLRVDGDELLLVSDDIADKPFLSGSYRKQRLEQGVALIADAPRLLKAGVDAFGGNYFEGTEFDPLIVVFNEVDWLSSSHP